MPGTYALGQPVEYRTNEGNWLDAIVLLDNTDDTVSLKVRHENGPWYQTKLLVALGTTYGKFRVK